MTAVESALEGIRAAGADLLLRHRELVRFALVDGATWVVDTGIFLALKSSLLEEKPVTAKVISVTVATLLSYGLNSGWSFPGRGRRRRHHEVLLYVLVSALAIGVYSAPLWLSRYAAGLRVPLVAPGVEHLADFVSGQVVGVLLGMVFRWWAFRRFVFPPGPRVRG